MLSSLGLVPRIQELAYAGARGMDGWSGQAATHDRGIGNAMMLSALFFYLFAGVTVAAGFMVIAAKNPVHAVLFLILAFFNAAGLFVLLGAEFLAMILVVVYVGAVAVLFLFVVMMLDVDFAELRAGFMKNAPLGALVGLILLAELVLVIGRALRQPEGARRADRADPGGRLRHHQHGSAGARALHRLRLLLPGRRA